MSQQPLRIAGTSHAEDAAAVDIDHLTEAELIDLNRRIVERLRMMQQLRAHKAMMQFSVGQRVRFHTDVRTVTGVITRYNRKTVTIIADTGEHWRVGPSVLEPA